MKEIDLLFADIVNQFAKLDKYELDNNLILDGKAEIEMSIAEIRRAYKKQEDIAIKFGEFIDENDLVFYGWRIWLSTNKEITIKADTTEELFNKFIEEYYETNRNNR